MSILKELIALREEESPEVELTTFKGNRIPHEAWPHGITYRGMNVYNTVYEGEVDAELASKIKEMQDDFDGKLDVQESYLGYSPSKDLFVQGYDGWFTIDAHDEDEDDEHGNCSPYIVFGLSDEGAPVHITDGEDISPLGKTWYGKGGGMEGAKRRYPDLIDIRLD